MIDPGIMIVAGAQAALLVISFFLSFTERGRPVVRAATWLSLVLTLAAVGMFVSLFTGLLAGATPDVRTVAMYAALSVGILVFQGGVRVLSDRSTLSAGGSRASRSRAAEELRTILMEHDRELDSRLRSAEEEREAFLYALEDRHARQIAGLAQEYQHEAHTILRQLLDQLAAEKLQPMVEQRLAEHQRKIESELGAIDSAAAGETLTRLHGEFTDLVSRLETAEQRVRAAADMNPDTPIEDKVAVRLAAIESTIDGRVAEAQDRFDRALESTLGEVEARIDSVGALLDAKVDAASNPLTLRMQQTQQQVEARLESYMEVLNGRFQETEEILNGRVIEQEHALEARVLEMEKSLDTRLGAHTQSVEALLGEHDEQLQVGLTEQTGAIANHFAGERDRLIGELTEHAVSLQERIAEELLGAEERARETVVATQDAWNRFTTELEDRFAATRDEALQAAQEIAQTERETLERAMQEIAGNASHDIAAQVEQLGREAAWQRAQVERTVAESMDTLKQTAQDAIENADTIFGDLERIGSERIDTIRRQAEDALVQSRDYVQQLEDSLGIHLESLREQSGDMANEMNSRLEHINTAAQQAVQHVESHSRDMVDSVSRELAALSEQQLQTLSHRLSNDVSNSLQASLSEQQRQYEAHLGELAQRIVQQVHGDIAGLAEQARGAVTGELEQVIGEAREHARQAQEQGFMEVMNDLSRQQHELAEHARSATDSTRHMLDESLRENRRQLDQAMASMGAHMREELVRFQDEGQRRVNAIIEQLRGKEHDLLRDEDRRLSQARQQLVRQHQGALEGQVKQMMGSLGSILGDEGARHEAPRIESPRPIAPPVPAQPAGAQLFASPTGDGNAPRQFAANVQRPATPLSPDGQPAQPGGFGPFQP